MTNEQKAQELTTAITEANDTVSSIDLYSALVEIAQWKDNQTKTELNRLMNRFQDDNSPQSYFASQTLNELYKNYFQNS